MVREIITLACSDCSGRNYTSYKNKKNTAGKLKIRKYCKMCRRHTAHKETR